MDSHLIKNANSILDLAKQSFFDLFEELSSGGMAVDENANIVWVNKTYLQFLGFETETDIIGKHIQSVLPNSLLPQVIETGIPILFDVMEYNNKSKVVSRFPLKNVEGVVIGAYGFILYNDLKHLVPFFSRMNILEDKLKKAMDNTRSSKYSFSQFIGNSEKIIALKEKARIASNKNSAVLITGATGTGKELLAQAIHSSSARSKNNFIAVNVAAIPENLLEVEFFGAVSGAYTGASAKGRKGKLQLADEGTLFLDELGDMPISMQVKLLRVLQEQEFEPVGSDKVIKINIRVIAATSQNLTALIDERKFRSDLYYRLNVIPIQIPPLCEHKSDLKLLCGYILDNIAQQNNEPIRAISDEAISYLSRYDWPGNIRELRNILDRACTMVADDTFTAAVFVDMLPVDLQKEEPSKPPLLSVDITNQSKALPEAILNLEKNMINNALVSTKGNKAKAAKLLGISRSQMYSKLNQLSLS
jgi:transcriptional regulator with PAS, ATPase and Fis domain